MKRKIAHLFLNARRRQMSVIGALLTLFGCTYGTVHYIDKVSATPSLSFLVFFGWIAMIVGASWVIVMGLSPTLLLPSVLEEWARDPWLDADSNRQIRLELPPVDPFDPRRLKMNVSLRFKAQFAAVAALTLGLTHYTCDHFLTRYQKSGYILTHLRSDQSQVRLRGLNLLVDRGKRFILGRTSTVPPQLRDALLNALKDRHEGVRGRAAFVTGTFDLIEAVPELTRMAEDDLSLREVALLALGHITADPLKQDVSRKALKTLTLSKEVLTSAPFAFSIAAGLQKLYIHATLTALYLAALPDDVRQEGMRVISTQDEDIRPHGDPITLDGLSDQEDLRIREATIWALGETRDSKVIGVLDLALRDPELRVRCLAAKSFERIVAFESSRPLRRAFERSKANEACPMIEAPSQEGTRGVVMMPKQKYQLTLARAIATTDDPELLTWIVDHQKGIDPMAYRLFYKYYKKLEEKNRAGFLEGFKKRNRQFKRDHRSP